MKLSLSKTAFSKVKYDLWFEDQQICSLSLSIPQSPLAAEEFELDSVLDMKGISDGHLAIKLEKYELGSTAEKLNQVTKEMIVEYVHQTRESQLVKVPIMKSVAGEDLAEASKSENDFCRQIEETAKKEL